MPWALVYHNLKGHPLRSLLTLGSIAIASFLLCFLRSVLVGLEAGVSASSSNRVVVQSAVSLFVDLPVSYQPRIAQVPGVAGVCKFQWFGGIYQDPGNFFAQFGVDADKFLDTYPEVRILRGPPPLSSDPEDAGRSAHERAARAFETRRTACLIGKDLSRKFGWGPGDTIPILGTIFPRTDGSAWQFDVVGVYESTSANVDQNTMFFRWDYLDETLETGGAGGPRGVGVYTVRLEPGAPVEAVSRKIDEMFQNGPQRVQATTEAEFQRQFVSMLGSVPTFLSSIGGGVLFAILFAVLNTMLMAARERTHDLGILKALGFSDGVAAGLLLCESLLLCTLGGLLGVGGMLALKAGLAVALSSFLPNFDVTPETALLSLGAAVAIGLLAGIVPAWQARQLRPVEALRAEV